ncbi:ATP-binding cassette domain-containing protein [Corynebacterium xerosis]|uniref:ATP-binding cassette domain-containing protein n=1 Tax=Corynebacterium xerosis TaxID=1725 RepID=A0A6B8THK2_9CORY|nr:ABC transporter ATP-binding protein [Corynebacterium xerosis]QGS35578.1 ATP-binding cassette domain-containing protein [Corynebacterium xerosis]
MTRNTDSPALLLRGVTKRFGDVTAVDGLDLSLARGRVLALLGPNGAGKTTTVEMCEGFVRPDGGEVRVLGLDPTCDTDELRTRIGIMLQGGGAYPGVRVGEMVELVASYSADPLDVDWLLDVVGLTRHRGTSYRRLSGGQQQRLSLACALVGRPELVFLDEPTAGLDAQSRLTVWDLVSSLRRDGVTVVLTTHLMDEAEALADDVLIIDRGRAVASGTTADITGGTSTQAAVVEFDRAIDARALAAHLTVPGGRAVDVDATAPNRYRVTGAATPEGIAAMAGWCAGQGALITELRVARRSLEDVFLDITGREMRS